MHPLTQIKGTEIYIVEISKKATDLKVIDRDAMICLRYFDGSNTRVPLPISYKSKERWQLLGTCDAEGFDFDVVEAGLVERWDSIANDGTFFYENYLKEIPKCRTELKSALSRLAANDLYFENPMGKAEPVLKYSDYDFGNDGLSESMAASIEADFDARLTQWQHHQSNLILGKLVFLKKLK